MNSKERFFYDYRKAAIRLRQAEIAAMGKCIDGKFLLDWYTSKQKWEESVKLTFPNSHIVTRKKLEI
jgi:hypothetical protein